MDAATYRTMASVEDKHWWFRARRAIVADAISQLNLPKDALIAEIGCGTGGNLSMLAKFGTVTGVEPDDFARAHASEKSGIAVVHGLLPDGLPLEPHSFDLVVACDVVEHVDDDHGALQALARLTKPGGRVLITVPANSWLWSPHDERHHHKRRYAGGQLRACLEGAGLEVSRLSHFNTLLMPVVIARRVLAKLVGLASHDDALPSQPVNAALEAVMTSEKNLMRLFPLPVGVSLLAVSQPAAA